MVSIIKIADILVSMKKERKINGKSAADGLSAHAITIKVCEAKACGTDSNRFHRIRETNIKPNKSSRAKLEQILGQQNSIKLTV